MQDLLNFVNDWCRKWRLFVFSKQMKYILETKEKRCNNFEFKVENQTVD